MVYSERTQVLLSPAQREKVERLAARTHRSAGAVIRDAIDAYVSRTTPDRRRQALEDLCALEAPVDEWEVLEQQITDGYVDRRPDAQ